MARLLVQSDDGGHRVMLMPDPFGEWGAVCNLHPDFELYERNRFRLQDAFEEASIHVDEH